MSKGMIFFMYCVDLWLIVYRVDIFFLRQLLCSFTNLRKRRSTFRNSDQKLLVKTNPWSYIEIIVSHGDRHQVYRDKTCVSIR